MVSGEFPGQARQWRGPSTPFPANKPPRNHPRISQNPQAPKSQTLVLPCHGEAAIYYVPSHRGEARRSDVEDDMPSLTSQDPRPLGSLVWSWGQSSLARAAHSLSWREGPVARRRLALPWSHTTRRGLRWRRAGVAGIICPLPCVSLPGDLRNIHHIYQPRHRSLLVPEPWGCCVRELVPISTAARNSSRKDPKASVYP